jgi:hypothetical protein
MTRQVLRRLVAGERQRVAEDGDMDASAMLCTHISRLILYIFTHTYALQVLRRLAAEERQRVAEDGDTDASAMFIDDVDDARDDDGSNVGVAGGVVGGGGVASGVGVGSGGVDGGGGVSDTTDWAGRALRVRKQPG